ncbi:hypothetical protein C3477_23860 [Mycobacterium kansasii]|uniref:hypothetical protein n=1 Tax=Mycobacterium kansasii TaxID=1768 RepID=UPI000CDD8EA9|nr:hypothetical protein [Mycobacterium kansasii]POX82192.1 hypothetical protein C3B43_25825 [Mycobacterium kansasii]POX98434.1 hypothetical protein C3477_23860 [Mycobacterium kansasii]POY20186.1 hypothetical protein C3476_15915 [Mycobacterium kansasii]
MDTTEPATEAVDDDVATEDDATSQIADADNLDDQQEPETFPRSYVEELRQENGKYRQRAQAGEVYAQRLHTELVRATGRLADPTDLPFDAEHLDDADKLAAAIDDLLSRKPHLANRRPVGDIGQGATPIRGTVDLAAILRQQAQ